MKKYTVSKSIRKEIPQFIINFILYLYELHNLGNNPKVVFILKKDKSTKKQLIEIPLINEIVMFESENVVKCKIAVKKDAKKVKISLIKL